MSDALSVGELREAIIYFCELGGAYGQNLSETKPVVIRRRGVYLPLTQVSVNFIRLNDAGRFALILDVEDE